jgi:Ca2+-dependent lipid-binding protein
MNSSTSGGHLQITFIEGDLTRDTETFGSMDPLVEVEYLGQKMRTRVHEGGGKRPNWN